MSGIDGILNIISSQQKVTEDNIIRNAETKAQAISADGDNKAQKAYDDYMKKNLLKAETDFKNACNSTDAENKRKILQCKVDIINSATEKIIERLENLPESEYFDMILRLVNKKMHSGEGVIYFGEKDLTRLPEGFRNKLPDKIKISNNPADIENGFILEYGLISENCSFRAILESEKDAVRDILAVELFGG